MERDENLKAEIDRVTRIMLGDSNDPTSYSYQRRFVRPSINWIGIIIRWLMVGAGIAALVIGLRLLSMSDQIIACAGVGFLAVVMLVSLKRSIILVVKIYQRYAPEGIRNKCRFEPSCSEYMILSLEKYGLIKGLSKGINRLQRCKIPNGGLDYP